MVFNSGHVSRANDFKDSESSTELVIIIYRCTMDGLVYGNTKSWEIGERLLTQSVPLKEVGPLFGRFYGLGRALLASAQRPLSHQPISYSGNCADEAFVLCMIEMSQRANHSGTLSAARILLGNDDLGSVLQAVQSLASALALCGLFVRSSPEGHKRPQS
jgi:hypothetical protein